MKPIVRVSLAFLLFLVVLFTIIASAIILNPGGVASNLKSNQKVDSNLKEAQTAANVFAGQSPVSPERYSIPNLRASGWEPLDGYSYVITGSPAGQNFCVSTSPPNDDNIYRYSFDDREPVKNPEKDCSEISAESFYQ